MAQGNEEQNKSSKSKITEWNWPLIREYIASEETAFDRAGPGPGNASQFVEYLTSMREAPGSTSSTA